VTSVAGTARGGGRATSSKERGGVASVPERIHNFLQSKEEVGGEHGEGGREKCRDSGRRKGLFETGTAGRLAADSDPQGASDKTTGS